MVVLCLFTFSMSFPSGVSSSAASERLGRTEVPSTRSTPALRAKRTHFRIILQISIAVGKESTSDGRRRQAGLNQAAGLFTQFKRYPGSRGGSRTAPARLLFNGWLKP
jgi:hypothetical protein